ncbi:MAG: flagellar biosynthetic protein FliR [Pseudomonadota bacterium]
MLEGPEAIGIVVTGAVAIVLRLSAMMMFLPGIGEIGVPMRVRMAVILALTAAISPVILPIQAGALAETDVVIVLGFEALIGFSLGFIFRLLILALSITGTIISQSASLSQIFGPSFGQEPNPTIGTLLMVLGTALFVTLDLHTHTVGLLMESYEAFPLGDVPDTGALSQWATRATASAFALAVSLALPFILISFLYYLVLGLMNQAMPQMMVTFIGVPANVLAGIVLLVLAITTISTVWLDAVKDGFGGFW